MTSNSSYNKRNFLNTPPHFNVETWIKIFIQSIILRLWETIINGPFILTHYVNSEVVDKPIFLWTKEDKRKIEFDFKVKNFLVISLNEN